MSSTRAQACVRVSIARSILVCLKPKKGTNIDIEIGTQTCQLIPAQIGHSKVLLLDTPGFDDTIRSDSEILTEIARILAAQYELGVQLKGIVYMQRITDIRMTGSSLKTFQIFQKICGETALKNVLLITSRWGEVEASLGSSRERELRDDFWAYMLGKGSNMSRFHGDRQSAISLIGQVLVKDGVVLELQRELVDGGKRLNETSAGAFLSDDLETLKVKYREELAGLERLKKELVENDRTMKRQIERDWAREQARLLNAEKQQVSLQAPVGVEVQATIQQTSAGSKSDALLRAGLGLLPTILSVLGMFVGIPSGTFETLASWIPGFTGLQNC